jgi:hypothetical protein
VLAFYAGLLLFVVVFMVVGMTVLWTIGHFALARRGIDMGQRQRGRHAMRHGERRATPDDSGPLINSDGAWRDMN